MDPLTTVAVVLFCALALWAILRKQPLDEISLGKVLKAKFKEPAPDEGVTFTVSWECEKYVLEARATLNVSGTNPVSLAVTRNNPFQTVSIRVPKAGQYAYSLEQQEDR